jgi:arylsulfatase A-like enzyme
VTGRKNVRKTINRRSFIRTTALGSAGMMVAARMRGAVKADRPPNLVVFLPDGHRSDTLACYGAGRSIAPNLDKLAGQSVVFQRAYVTQPICTPSRSSLMTGAWPHVTGCLYNGTRLPKDLKCLPEMMGANEYHFGYSGKWHLGYEVTPQHGFQEWTSIHFSNEINPATGAREETLSDYEKFLIANNQKPDRRDGRVFSPRFESDLPIELSKPRFLQEKACDYLSRHQHEPFVLYVAFFEPHPPYNGPLNNAHPLDQLNLDATADQTFGSDLPLRYRALQSKWHEVYGRAREKRLSIKGNYLGLVTEIDQSIGVILARLEQLGLAENTIVMHAADHGDMMTAHGLFGKSVMFEEATRIPWMVRLPGQTRQLAVSQPVSTIDFVPTILDLLGQPPHSQCAGKSLVPLIRGENVPPANVFVEWHPSRRREDPPKHMGLFERFTARQAMAEITRAVISPDGWKLCRRDADVNELYNLKSDPTESQNLYAHSAGQEVVRRLTDDIHRWQERVGDKAKV